MRLFLLTRNRLEKQYLRLIALSLILPTLIIGGCLYYVIFNLMAEQLGIPEVIAYHLLPVVRKVNVVMATSLPVIFIILGAIGTVLARRLVGPIQRLENELNEIAKGDFTKRLHLRRDDVLRPLADKINLLLDKLD